MIGLDILIALAAAAGGSGEGKEAHLARCAWEEAATSTATLAARAKFDRRYVYEADGSPTVGPLLRVRAACWSRSKDHYARTGQSAAGFDTRKFLKLLAASKPREIAPDRFVGTVRRCEYHFLDASAGAKPAAIIWSFEANGTTQEMQRSEQVDGFATSADILAALSPKNSGAELLDRANAFEPVRVATIAAGRASGKGFAVDTATARRSCRAVEPDGSYTNA